MVKSQAFDNKSESSSHGRISTGVEGLDELLNGGLIPYRRYLIRGAPGLGKTTLGLMFLNEYEGNGDSLFIGFQEPEDELRTNAASVGIDVDGIHFLSLSPNEEFFTQSESYDVFASSDIEHGPLVNTVVESVKQIKPKRVFVDSLTQLRFLSSDVYQYRKQALSFLRFLTERGVTVVFSSESSSHLPDDDLQFLADGIINLQPKASHSTISIHKFRGSRFTKGLHQYRIDNKGFHVFPRLRPPTSQIVNTKPTQMKSGNNELDAMLHGGLESGTVTLLTGPTGIGKSTIAGNFAIQAAKSSYRSAVYIFDEEINTFIWRLRSLNVDIDTPYKNDDLILEQVEPLRYLADEFTSLVHQQVEEENIKLIVLDSITGLELATENVEGINETLHAFAKSLARLGVTVILVNENEVTTNQLQASQRNISYLADNVIYLRYVQPDETLQKVIGILKKRLTGYENSLRQFEIVSGGLKLTDITNKVENSIAVGQGPESAS